MRSDLIEQSFAARAHSYDAGARLQKLVADRLAGFLPALDKPRVLEIGCGTGLFTEHLLRAYPEAEFHITDIAPEMLAVCRGKFDGPSNVSFDVLDGNTLADHSARYDLIVSAMNVQWFDDPLQALADMQACLNEGGQVLYSTIGAASFPEWRASLKEFDAPVGLLDVPVWPAGHVFEEENIVLDYGSAAGFLRALKDVGAASPRAGYTPLNSATMRKVCAYFDAHYGGRSSWDIIYGRLNAL